MSLFKSLSLKNKPMTVQPSSEARARLQHQLYLARECPDPIFDISSCELTEIPSGVFSLCKVLQKESLLIHTNKLSEVKGSGSLSELSGIRILDLHNNELVNLPEDIGVLRNLQVLNVESNRIKSVPESIKLLSALQTLNLKGNQLKSIPDGLCQLCSLRFLDISDNFVVTLPKMLCRIKTMEMLIVDVVKMNYPSSGVCAQGTEAIMKLLCKDSGVEYIPPSAALLNVLPIGKTTLSGQSVPLGCDTSADLAIINTVMQYECLKEKRRQESLELERQLEEDQRQQSMLAIQAASNKNHILMSITRDREKMDKKLMVAQQKKEIQKDKLLEVLSNAEINAGELIIRLLEMNEKARKTEELLDKMETDRIQAEKWYLVRQEELNNIRKKDVLSSMEEILKHENMMAGTLIKHLSGQDDLVKKSKQLSDDADEQVDSVLSAKLSQQKVLINRLLTEELLQKEAFKVLQCQKDARHKRITSEIMLIQQELVELTLLEIEQRNVKLDTQMYVLSERRKALTQLLLQLFDEQSKRQKELYARMVEMEEQRLAHQTDYWLVQYQRLLDSKPQSQIDQERRVEYEVINILEAAGAGAYLPQFARNHISVETLLQMSDADLAGIGVHEPGLRRAIMNQLIESKKSLKRKQSYEKKQADIVVAQEEERQTDEEEVLARGFNTECIVCMDAKSIVLFLNCGHVCTCAKCSETLKECPLDRCHIVKKIRLVMATVDAE